MNFTGCIVYCDSTENRGAVNAGSKMEDPNDEGPNPDGRPRQKFRMQQGWPNRYVLSVSEGTVRTALQYNAVITIAIRLRSDYDASRAFASNSTQAKNSMSIFRRSRIVVVS